MRVTKRVEPPSLRDVVCEYCKSEITIEDYRELRVTINDFVQPPQKYTWFQCPVCNHEIVITREDYIRYHDAPVFAFSNPREVPLANPEGFISIK